MLFMTSSVCAPLFVGSSRRGVRVRERSALRHLTGLGSRNKPFIIFFSYFTSIVHVSVSLQLKTTCDLSLE